MAKGTSPMLRMGLMEEEEGQLNFVHRYQHTFVEAVVSSSIICGCEGTVKMVVFAFCFRVTLSRSNLCDVRKWNP